MATDPIKALVDSDETIISIAKSALSFLVSPEREARAIELMSRGAVMNGVIEPLKVVHDVLHNARAMISDRDEGFRRIGMAMESVRSILAAIEALKPPASPATPERILELEDKLERVLRR